MNETSSSLLERLRSSDRSDGWTRMRELYSPLLRAWMRRHDVDENDADDLMQEVFLTVSSDIASFDHNGRPGAFRTWLKRILVNRLREFWRTRARQPLAGGGSDCMRRLQQLEDPHSELSRTWDREHDQQVLRQLLAAAEPNFAPKTWKAFRHVVIDGLPADEVAERLEISLNTVFIAKSRVIRRLREEADGLIESSSGFFAKS